MDSTVAVLMFGLLLVGCVLGFPIAFVLGGLATLFGLAYWGSGVLLMFVSRGYGMMSDYIMIAVPLFVLMGYIMEQTGIAVRLYNGLYFIFGPVRGGLGIATIVVCTLFAASTGIIGASIVTMGLLALPMMLKYGYAKDLASGTVCAGGDLGILIPPSIMLVVLGSQATLSVGRLFLGAFPPGLLLSALYMAYIAVRCLLRPKDGPAMTKDERTAMPVRMRLTKAVEGVIPPILLIFCVLGAIFLGIATPTEAAAIGAFIALLIGLLYREVSWNKLRAALIGTLKTTAMVLFVMLGASCFTAVFLGLGGGDVVTGFLVGLGLGPYGLLALMLFIIFVLGMFIDWIGILLITIPIFMPLAKLLGFDPLWFGIIMCLDLQMSFLTPPFAPATFYLKGVAPPDVQYTDMYKGIWPYLILIAICIAICVLFPEVVTWLPEKMIK
jgi:tripartite ATP-independent transporter DctM subunit